MSIYVGGERAKLYRGDYGPAQFYKGDVKIAGYTNGEKVGAQISGVDTYNDALLPTIGGKSEQAVTVLGKNLLNCSRRTDRPDTPSTWNPDTGILFVKGLWFTAVPITLDPDTDYYFSAIREGATAAGGGAVSIFVATGTASGDQVAAIAGGKGAFHTRPAVTEYQILLYAAYGTQGECTFRNLSVSKGTQPIPYEPFVPNSPSPDYPSPIRSSENFDVVSCGRNLVDVYKWGNAYDVVPIDNVITQTFTTGALFLNVTRTPMKLKPNHTYSIVVSVLKSDSTDINGYTGLWGYDNGFDDGGRFIGSTRIVENSVSVRKFTTSPDGNFALGIGGGGGVPYTLSLHIMILEGTYTAETLPPYEPYHATTAHITDPLRSVGDVADSIEVSEGKVEVVRRVENRRLTASDIAIFNPDSYKNVTYFQISKTSDDINIGDYRNAIPLLCEFAQFSDYRPSGFDSATQVDKICTGGNNFYLVGFTHGTTEVQGKEKLANTNYLYALKTPTRTDITATPLGQALLAMRTYPHYTQVYTNATLPPTIRARIKEMEL